MTETEKAEALLEIVRDELNVKRIILGRQNIGGAEIEVEYNDGKIRVFKNGGLVDAPKTAAMFANKFLEGRGL